MDYKELYVKYRALLGENSDLKTEIKRLKAQLGISESQEVVSNEIKTESDLGQISEHCDDVQELNSNINNCSGNNEKIKLFMSVFRGRDDVYARRWQNKSGKSGYTPVCLNEWKPGVCYKPNVKCSECSQKLCARFDEEV